MSKEAQPRPGQATLAGALIIGCSVVVVLTAWQRISTLHTIEVQEQLQRALSEPPFDGLGMSLDALSRLVRVLCMVAAGAATAATILGFQVFKRSTSARVVLTALAPLILVGGFATAGFFAPMVVAGITMLWLQPTRDWYAGRPWQQRYEQRRAERVAAIRGQAPPVAGPVTDKGADPVVGVPVMGGSSPPKEPGRPPALVWACSLAWVASSMVAIGLVISVLAIAAQGDELIADFEEQQGRTFESYGFSEDALLAVVYVMCVGLLLWAVLAIVLAVLAFGGRNWARIALAVSSASAGMGCLLMAVANPALVVLVAVLAVSTWLLLRSDVSAWYRR